MIISKTEAKVVKDDTFVIFGSGDVSVDVKEQTNGCGKPCGVNIIFEQLENKKELGEKVPDSDVKKDSPKVTLAFDNKESIMLVIDQLIKAKKIFIEKENAENPFIVPLRNIIIPDSFRNSNPAAEKIMKCYDHYKRYGCFDRNIVVDSALRIKDGYVAYVVASFLGLDKVTVIVNGTISIKIGNDILGFNNNKVGVNVKFDEKSEDLSNPNTKMTFTFNNGIKKTGEIHAENTSEAVKYFAKIKNVFEPYFVVVFDNVDITKGIKSDLAKELIRSGISYQFIS